MAMSAVPTKEENILIYEYIILPLVQSVMERQLDKVRRETSILSSLYIRSTEILIDQVHRDIINVKKYLKESGIKVWAVESDPPYLKYEYACRRYTSNVIMTKASVKSELEIRLGKYVSGLEKKIKCTID